jgi:outer membrane protein, heavy metal efflux system
MSDTKSQKHFKKQSSTSPVPIIALEIGVQLHIFDHNRGNVAAARVDVEKAEKELQRIDLSLRERFAATLQSYRDARTVVERYHSEILPRAHQAYELMVSGTA